MKTLESEMLPLHQASMQLATFMLIPDCKGRVESEVDWEGTEIGIERASLPV
jgi:hypothetical protein